MIHLKKDLGIHNVRLSRNYESEEEMDQLIDIMMSQKHYRELED
jgi:hypothetical protein